MSQNNGSPRPSPVATLASAEAGMIAQLNRVADRLDAIGQGSLDDAVARVKASAAAAQARLEAARRAMDAAALEVATCLDLIAAEVSGEWAPAAAASAAAQVSPPPAAPRRIVFPCERLAPADPFGFPALPGDVPDSMTEAASRGVEAFGQGEAPPEPAEAAKGDGKPARRRGRAK